MPNTYRVRRELQRDAHTELYVLNKARRDDLLKNKNVEQYADPIKAARAELLAIKVDLEAQGLEEEP